MRGQEHPGYQDGRYSKYLPRELRERFAAGLNDPALLELRSELALTDARVSSLLEEIGRGDDADTWSAIMDAIETRRRLAESEARRLAAARQLLTLEEALLLMDGYVTAVRSSVYQHVAEREARKIMGDVARAFDRFTNLPDEG